MPIFGNTAQMRELQTRSGDLHLSNPWAEEFTERLQSRMRQFGEASQTKTMELEGEFKDFGLKESGSELREARLKEAGLESQKALTNIERAKGRGGKISSLSQLVQSREQKRQRLQQAKQSLERAQEFYKATGSQFQYKETGYNVETPEAATYEQMFDDAVAERRQEYAEMYGYDRFEDAFEGYGMLNYDTNQDGSVAYRGVGQRDIMDMVMSDITGMSYEDLARLNTVHVQDRGNVATHGDLSSYTPDQMEVLRDFFVTSNVGAFEAAASRAEAEDKFRQESVAAAKQQALSGARALEKKSGEKLGSSLEDVQLQLRELDDDFMKKVGSFKSSARRRKVKSVSFDKGRPQ